MRYRSLLLCLLALCLSFPTVSVFSQSCPTPRLVIGEQGRVTPGAANRVRADPGVNGTLLGEIPGGAVFEVLEGPRCIDGLNWWRVEYGDLIGWTAEGNATTYFLEPISPRSAGRTATPAPTLNTTSGACATGVAPALRLIVGRPGFAIATTPVRIRSAAGTGNRQIGQIDPNGVFQVLEGPVCADRLNWWRIEHVGIVGWIAEGTNEAYFVDLVPATATPTATRTPTATFTPTITRTPTITLTPSITPTFTNTAIPLAELSDIAWSAEGEFLAVASERGVYRFNAEDFSEAPIQLSDLEAQSVAYHPTDPTLLAVAVGGTLEFWQEDELIASYDISGPENITDLDYDLTGDRLWIQTEIGAFMFDTEQAVSELMIPNGETITAMRPDGLLMAAAFEDVILLYLLPPDQFTKIDLFAMDRGDRLQTQIRALTFSDDRRYLAAGDELGNIQVWDFEGWNGSDPGFDFPRIGFIRGEGISSSNRVDELHFAPNHTDLISIEGDPWDVLRVFDVVNELQVDNYGIEEFSGMETGAFSLDGAYFALIDSRTVLILDTETYEPIAMLIVTY